MHMGHTHSRIHEHTPIQACTHTHIDTRDGIKTICGIEFTHRHFLCVEYFFPIL